jgi:hypothetical protein
MAQMSLFSRAEVTAMRDRTASRNYSATRDEFRREHERHRAWGLRRRHAEKLRRIREAASVPVAGTPAVSDSPTEPLTVPDPHQAPATSSPHARRPVASSSPMPEIAVSSSSAPVSLGSPFAASSASRPAAVASSGLSSALPSPALEIVALSSSAPASRASLFAASSASPPATMASPASPSPASPFAASPSASPPVAMTFPALSSVSACSGSSFLATPPAAQPLLVPPARQPTPRQGLSRCSRRGRGPLTCRNYSLCRRWLPDDRFSLGPVCVAVDPDGAGGDRCFRTTGTAVRASAVSINVDRVACGDQFGPGHLVDTAKADGASWIFLAGAQRCLETFETALTAIHTRSAGAGKLTRPPPARPVPAARPAPAPPAARRRPTRRLSAAQPLAAGACYRRPSVAATPPLVARPVTPPSAAAAAIPVPAGMWLEEPP